MHKALLCLLPALAATPAWAGEWELSGSAGAELRTFAEKGAFPGQLDYFQPSLELEGDIRWHSDDGKWDVVAIPYLRLDARDDQRTHGDLREAYLRYTGETVSARIGLGKVFWGVAESRHLVDIINQSDSIEDIDEEDKFGQPMLEVERQTDFGRFTAYLLPGFRERIYPGVNGRLRGPLLVDEDAAQFDGGRDDDGNDLDFALRYSHYFGDFDVGLSLFHGTSREARLLPNATNTAFVPWYDDITQVGVDVQYTHEAWLWKFEAIVRDTPFETFFAGVGGFEYTFYGVTDSGADLGVLLEYQHDDRSDNPLIAPLTTADDDIFGGLRYALNDTADTSILAGAIVDTGDGSMSAIVEATRRFGEVWVGEIEARMFMNVDPANPAYLFKDDSHVMLRLTRYF